MLEPKHNLRSRGDDVAKADASNLGRTLTIGAMAARSGAAVSTLHFYEAKGLISSSRNTGATNDAMRARC